MISLRYMEKEDIDGVLTVEKESFSTPWTEKLFLDEVENPRTVYYVAETESGEIAGYGGMWHVVDEGQITNIAVKKAFRGEGVGSKLLGSLINWAKDNGIRVIELEVRAGNTAALGLYNKYGFNAVGRRKDYYKNPTEDAILMDLLVDQKEVLDG